MAVITYSVSGQDHFVVVDIICKVAVITSSLAGTNLLVTKITFAVANITFKVAVITFSVVKITFIVAEITFIVVLITSSVAKITLYWLR